MAEKTNFVDWVKDITARADSIQKRSDQTPRHYYARKTEDKDKKEMTAQEKRFHREHMTYRMYNRMIPMNEPRLRWPWLPDGEPVPNEVQALFPDTRKGVVELDRDSLIIILRTYGLNTIASNDDVLRGRLIQFLW